MTKYSVCVRVDDGDMKVRNQRHGRESYNLPVDLGFAVQQCLQDAYPRVCLVLAEAISAEGYSRRLDVIDRSSLDESDNRLAALFDEALAYIEYWKKHDEELDDRIAAKARGDTEAQRGVEVQP